MLGVVYFERERERQRESVCVCERERANDLLDLTLLGRARRRPVRRPAWCFAISVQYSVVSIEVCWSSVLSFESAVQCLVLTLEFSVQCLVFRVSCLRFRVSGEGFADQGLG